MPKLIFRNITENYQEWQKSRINYIGSSEIVTIAGLNPYESPLELWAKKTGKVADDFKGNLATKYGKAVEPVLRMMFSEVHPEFLIVPSDDTYQHDELEWATATPDSFITVDSLHADKELLDYDLSGSDRGIVELKHTSIYDGWEEGAPNYAHIQLMWQMGVMNVDWGFICAVVAGRASDVKTPFFRFERDIFDQLLELSSKFIEMVRSDTPPDAGSGDAKIIDKLCERHEKEVDIDGEQWENTFIKLSELKEQKKVAESEIKAIENQIKLSLGDATQGNFPNHTVKLSQVFRKPYYCEGSSYWKMNIKESK